MAALELPDTMNVQNGTDAVLLLAYVGQERVGL